MSEPVEPRGRRRLVGKVVFASMFLVAGVGHFTSTEFFLKVMPPYLPYPRELILLSGAIEITLGLLLLAPRTSRIAAWGLIALLIAVFPANIHVYLNRDAFPLPGFVHLIRLPAQGLLIYWAYRYTRS